MPKHALYRFYNDGGQLLYTGITNSPERRFTEHAKEKHWWEDVRGIAIDWYEDRESVLAAEKRAIRIEKPVYNIRGKEALKGEFTRKDNMETAAAVAFCRLWTQGENTRHLWEPFNQSLERAIEAGYSYLEITEAALLAGQFREPDLTSYLPVYPGHIHESSVARLARALNYLNLFLEEEVRIFRALAAAEEEMWNAHWHELTIRAAEIGDFQIEEYGRDEEILRRYLETLADGESLITHAHEEFNAHQGIHPVPRDASEVLELAVANAMGVNTPHSRTVRLVH